MLSTESMGRSISWRSTMGGRPFLEHARLDGPGATIVHSLQPEQAEYSGKCACEGGGKKRNRQNYELGCPAE